MAPIFVGSNSDDSKIKLDRVSVAASTADPGSASVGDAYYNSSDNNLKFYDGSSWSAVKGAGTVDLVASGDIADGKPVVINSDGTVGIVTGAAQTEDSTTDQTFESGETTHKGIAYDTSNDRIVVAYCDRGNSEHGTACVGSISGTTITWGTPVVFNSVSSEHVDVAFDTNSGKVVIGFKDSSVSNRCHAIVGTVSGTSISFGTKVAVEPNNDNCTRIKVTYDSNAQKVVFTWRAYGTGRQGYGQSAVGTVSGTSISFGSVTTFHAGNCQQLDACFVPGDNKIVIAFKDNSDSGKGKAIVGTVSGTSISYGSVATFYSVTNAIDPKVEYHPEDDRIMVLFHDGARPGVLESCIASLSGTTLTFSSSTDDIFSNSGNANQDNGADLCYDPYAKKMIVFYDDETNSECRAVVATINTSTNRTTFGTAVGLSTNKCGNLSAVNNPDENANIIAYTELIGSAENGIGRASAFKPGFIDTTLTSENFIGFSNAAYTNGQTASIQVVSTVDDAQSGLTTGKKHYVQADGTLSTTEGTPSVFAGTAISATKISVKY